MDLKINKETVSASEHIYDGMQEQGVELDYILPDYYPDIFRLVRCETIPSITDYAVSGDRLTYELTCDIRILYCSEGSSLIQCVCQRQRYSKSLDLGRFCENPTVSLCPKSDHFNCRAVNKRRLDVRGAVSVKIKVDCDKKQEVISDVFGMNVQLKKQALRFAAHKLTAEKNLQLTEETELSASQPPAVNIVSCRCKASECDKKMISGKLLAKGEVDISLLYSYEKDGEGALEPLSFSVPYSQIIDIDGLDDSFECGVTAEVVSCDIIPAADKNGDNKLLKCELELRIICRAVKIASVTLGTDAFSTTYPCEITSSEITAEQLPSVISESFRHTASIAEGDSVPQEIYSMWCTPKNINTRLSDDGSGLFISGMLTYTMAAKDASGMIIMPDRDEAFEQEIELPDDCRNSRITAEIGVGNVSYNISPENVLTVKAELTAKLHSCASASMTGLTDIMIDDTTKKERDGDYAIKLYYGVENEDVWDIAKRYSTCVSAVMEENELMGDRLESGGMLLIPIIS